MPGALDPTPSIHLAPIPRSRKEPAAAPLFPDGRPPCHFLPGVWHQKCSQASGAGKHRGHHPSHPAFDHWCRHEEPVPRKTFGRSGMPAWPKFTLRHLDFRKDLHRCLFSRSKRNVKRIFTFTRKAASLTKVCHGGLGKVS